LGSGKGKTAGKGGIGQTARSGVSLGGFGGGQMPLIRRMPKRGFNNIFAKDYSEINLGRLQKAIDDKKIDIKQSITSESLMAAGIVPHAKDGVRLLGNGEIKAKVQLTLAGASKSAKAAVEKAGGTITITVPKAKWKKAPRVAA
jgi:large subunit ribosomal protein L15